MMNEFTTLARAAQAQPARSVAILVSVAIFIGYALFTLDILSMLADGTMRNDYWRHFRQILIPILEEDASIGLLWSNHHHNPVMHLHQLLSAQFLGLNVRLDDYIMFVAYSIFLVVMLSRFFGVPAGSAWSAYDKGKWIVALIQMIVAYLAISALLGGRHQVFYSGPLITLQTYPHIAALLLGVAFLYGSANKPGFKAYLPLVLAVLFQLLTHFSFGMIYIVSMTVVVAAYYFRSGRCPRIAFAGAVMIGTAAIYAIIMFALLPPSEAGDGSMMARALASIPRAFELIWMFGEASTLALVGETSLNAAGRIGGSILILINIVVVLACAAAGLLGGRRFLLPTLFVVFGILVAVAGSVARDNIVLAAPRLAGNYELMWMGCVLVAATYLLRLKRFDRVTIALTAAFGAWAVPTAVMATVSAADLMAEARFREPRVHGRELTLYLTGLEENDIKLPRAVRGGNGNVGEVLDHIQANELNVFAPWGQSRPGIARHMSARAVCRPDAETSVTAAEVLQPSIAEQMFVRADFTIERGAFSCVRTRTPHEGSVYQFEVLASQYQPVGVRVRQAASSSTQILPVSEGSQTLYLELNEAGPTEICVAGNVEQVNLGTCR